MDKPRHPQVIQTWKMQQSQKSRWTAKLQHSRHSGHGRKAFGPKPS